MRRVKSILIRPLFLPFSFSLRLVLFHDRKLLLLKVKIFQKVSFSVEELGSVLKNISQMFIRILKSSKLSQLIFSHWFLRFEFEITTEAFWKRFNSKLFRAKIIRVKMGKLSKILLSTIVCLSVNGQEDATFQVTSCNADVGMK